MKLHGYADSIAIQQNKKSKRVTEKAIRIYYVYQFKKRMFLMGPYLTYQQPNGECIPPKPEWFHDGWEMYNEREVNDTVLDNVLSRSKSTITYYRIPHCTIMEQWIKRNLFDIHQTAKDRHQKDEIDFCIHVEETDNGVPTVRYITAPAYSINRDLPLKGGWIGPWTAGMDRLEDLLRATGFESLQHINFESFQRETQQYYWYERLLMWIRQQFPICIGK